MAEEGEAQPGIGSDALQAVLGVDGGLVDRVGAEVGELGRFEVSPDELDGIEIVGVAPIPFP